MYSAFDENEPYANIVGNSSEDEASMLVGGTRRKLRQVTRKFLPRKIARGKLIDDNSNHYQLRYEDDLIFLNKFD